MKKEIKQYIVSFNFTVKVEAENKKKAEIIAIEDYYTENYPPPLKDLTILIKKKESENA